MDNVIIFGVGKTGSRLFVNVLEVLGWNLGSVKKNNKENIWVQNINKQILLEQNICPCGVYTDEKICHICHRNLIEFEKLPLDPITCIKSISQPWVIKDPRFVLTLNNNLWKQIWEEYKPFMLYITRDKDYLYKKYIKVWKQTNNIYGQSLDKMIEIAYNKYLKWKYNKIHISFEQLIQAGNLIDFIRADKI